MDRTAAVYLYCVVKSARKPSTASVPPGLEGGTTPEAVALTRGLWLVTADVPLDVYGPGQLEPKLQDLDWVADVAVAHEGVNEHFARLKGTTVVPTKLFTMFSSRERAVADLSRQRSELDRVIRRVAGCDEWGIRVRHSAGVPVARRGGRTAKASETPATGAAFLAARRDARDAAKAARGEAALAAQSAFDRLARLARDSRRRERGPEGGSNPPILEAAFLVPVKGRTRFKAEAKRQAAVCASAGADMTLTGPWPAYSFVSREGRA
jgi:hypothetical protein